MRCKRDILVCCFSVKPESFLDSNTGVVEDDSSGDTAKILKSTDQGILKTFDRLQCFSDFCIPAQIPVRSLEHKKAYQM